MTKYFTVDRIGDLRQGKVLELVKHNDISINDFDSLSKFDSIYDNENPQNDLQNHVNKLFPKGLSSHGNYYFLNNQQNSQIASPNIELIFEYIRRSCFPDQPSRFESVFSCETLEQAETFRNKYGHGSIWALECELSFRADMNLLTLGHEASILSVSYWSHRYWSGLASINQPPFWEYLLTPPIYVMEKVSD